MIYGSYSTIPALDNLSLNVLIISGAGLDMINDHPESSDEDSTDQKPLIPGHLGEHEDYSGPGLGAGRGKPTGPPTPAGGKKTKGRVKIKMEFIDNKLRRYTTFSKRKTGIMKKVRLRKIRKGINLLKGNGTLNLCIKSLAWKSNTDKDNGIGWTVSTLLCVKLKLRVKLWAKASPSLL